MEMLPPFDSPSRKEIIEILKYDDDRSTLESSIKNHHFNHAFDVFIPGLNDLPPDCEALFANSDFEYYIVHDVGLDKLLDMDFIGAFVKKGKLSVLSDKTWIDVDNSVCVYHPGILVISLTKDDYEELGLQGKPSRFGRNRKKPDKYIVTLDLTSDSFFPGKKAYDCALKIFRERKRLKFDLIFSWIPHDDSVSIRSLYSYLLSWGHDVDICVQNKKLAFVPNSVVPNITPSTLKEHEIFDDFVEYIGTLSHDIKFKQKTTTSYEYLPLLKGQWSGFLSTEWIYNFTLTLKNLAAKYNLPWAAIAIHGFDDVPVSWNDDEHGYTINGDNLCTIVFFPDSWYLMCKGLGTNDSVPNCKPRKSFVKQSDNNMDK